MKPGTLAKLKPGTAIGATRNFAATFNWVVDFCNNLSGGPGVEVDRTSEDRPIIRMGADKTLQAPLKPWTVQWRDEAWQVYLPASALSILHFDIALEEGSAPDWYLIQGQEGYEFEGEEIYFEVNAHIKYFCFRSDREDPLVNHNAVVTVDVSDADNPLSDKSQAGDIYLMDVARVWIYPNEEVEGAEPRRLVQQFMKSTVYVEHRYNGTLGMMWKWDKDTFPAEFTPFIPAQAAPICGGEIEEVELAVHDDNNRYPVYYLIDCTGATPVPSVVEEEPEDMKGKLSIYIYSQKQGRVIEDHRNDLNRAVYYP